jgi:hypothetical protein
LRKSSVTSRNAVGGGRRALGATAAAILLKAGELEAEYQHGNPVQCDESYRQARDASEMAKPLPELGFLVK